MGTQVRWQGCRAEWIVVGMTIVGLSLLPSRTRHEVVRNFSKPLVIQTSKTSPPRIAFHETIDRNVSSALVEQNSKGFTKIDLNQMLAQDSTIQGLKAVRYKKISLSPMQVPRESALRVMEERAWVENLSSDQRDRLEIANREHRTLEKEWKIPSRADLYAEKIQEIENQTERVQQYKVFVQGTDSNGNPVTPEDLHKGVGVAPGPNPNMPEITRNQSSFAVGGPIHITGGAALVPGSHIEIHWFDEGISKSRGTVSDVDKNAKYQIQVGALSGTVEARLVQQDGYELGSASYRLNKNENLRNLQNIQLELKPRNQVAGTFRNIETPNDPKARARTIAKNPSPDVLVSALNSEIKADADGFVREEGIGEHSWTFMRTKKEGYYSSLYVAQAGKEADFTLMEDRFAKAFLQAVRDNRGSGLGGDTGSVIWGKITKNGKPVSGVRVEIEDLADARPVYFYYTTFIPDEKANETSASGGFAFSDLPRGFYSLRVLRGNQQIGIANVEVDDQTVTPLEIKVEVPVEKVAVKVYDAFMGSPGVAQVEIQSLAHSVQINGFADLEIAPTESVSLVQVNPVDNMYAPTVQVRTDSEDYLHLPLIRLDWLFSLKMHAKVNEAPDQGTIVGFVPAEDYEIYLPHESAESPAVIVYFDAQGMPTASGVAGGGFAIFNASPGSQTVVVVPKESSVVHSQILPVDAGIIHVLKYDF